MASLHAQVQLSVLPPFTFARCRVVKRKRMKTSQKDNNRHKVILLSVSILFTTGSSIHTGTFSAQKIHFYPPFQSSVLLFGSLSHNSTTIMGLGCKVERTIPS